MEPVDHMNGRSTQLCKTALAVHGVCVVAGGLMLCGGLQLLPPGRDQAATTIVGGLLLTVGVLWSLSIFMRAQPVLWNRWSILYVSILSVEFLAVLTPFMFAWLRQFQEWDVILFGYGLTMLFAMLYPGLRLSALIERYDKNNGLAPWPKTKRRLMALIWALGLCAPVFFLTYSPAREAIHRYLHQIEYNEMDACRACKNFEVAQNTYLQTAGKANGEYAQTLQELASCGLLSKEIADAEGLNGKPYHGYLFKVLTSQGPQSPGGLRNYIVNGHMTVGYAICAIPYQWNKTGRAMVLLGSSGTVYANDFGPNTTFQSAYDPTGFICDYFGD